MQKLLVASVMFVLFLSACSKNVLSVTRNDISGTWILKNISGGFAGIDSTPVDKITIAFQTNGKYTSGFNDSTTNEGNYSIAKAPEPNYYYNENVITLVSDNGDVTYGIDLRNDSLFLSQPCCDQFGYTYIRQK